LVQAVLAWVPVTVLAYEEEMTFLAGFCAKAVTVVSAEADGPVVLADSSMVSACADRGTSRKSTTIPPVSRAVLAARMAIWRNIVCGMRTLASGPRPPAVGRRKAASMAN
jgi:hypothetical protein